ncbi:ATP synthase F0 subunit B [Candidatus Dojkabacteria bacterium]|nr:ATP synthase F0 subunit B [Candidatus Dojkabacteria bacterium]
MEALGINLVSIIIYIILFAVLYLLMNKFFLKKIFIALEKRQEDLDKGHEYTSKAEEKLKNIDIESRKIIEKSKEDAKTIKENILHESEIERKALLEKTKLEASLIIEKANKRFEEYKKDHDARVQQEIGEKAMQIVKELIGDEKQLDKALVDRYISKI